MATYGLHIMTFYPEMPSYSEPQNWKFTALSETTSISASVTYAHSSHHPPAGDHFTAFCQGEVLLFVHVHVDLLCTCTWLAWSKPLIIECHFLSPALNACSFSL